ncbi:hypothetical protein [Azospirillum endophyticum]
MPGRDRGLLHGTSLGSENFGFGAYGEADATRLQPYVTRGKIDAADAKAVCEAVTRLTMHFVAIATIPGSGTADTPAGSGPDAQSSPAKRSAGGALVTSRVEGILYV